MMRVAWAVLALYAGAPAPAAAGWRAACDGDAAMICPDAKPKELKDCLMKSVNGLTRSCRRALLGTAESKSSSAKKTKQTDAVTVNPPAPAPDIEEVRKQLQAKGFKKTKNGDIILIQDGGVGLALSAKPKDDAIARWSSCVGRYTACIKANPPPRDMTQPADRERFLASALDGCVNLIPVCPGGPNDGGKNCCPSACIQDYKSQRASGTPMEKAYQASFERGSCVSGFTEQKAAAYGAKQ